MFRRGYTSDRQDLFSSPDESMRQVIFIGPVAVGTPVTERPPHRTRRAQLRHRAPTSGDDGKVYASRRRSRLELHVCPAPCPVRAPCSAFPLAPTLRSTNSPPARAGDFAGFLATTIGSDFSRPSIIGFGPPAFPMRTARYPGRSGGRSPGSQTRSVRACRGLRPRGVQTGARKSRSRPCCLPCTRPRRHPVVTGCRGSMAGLHAPLSTLRNGPHGPLRMTRGRCGSLGLHRRGLSPHTPCRYPGAPRSLRAHRRL
jgi:hypothetical protein